MTPRPDRSAGWLVRRGEVPSSGLRGRTTPGADGLQPRAITTGELDEFIRTFEPAFGDFLPPGLRAYLRDTTEVDRAYAVFDAGQMVATGETWTIDLTVPGGTVPVAGLTSGRVLPTYRRRGLITRLVRHRLDQAVERGEPLACLWPSDSAIHGRFGFAPATWAAAVRVEPAHAQAIEPLDPGHRVRLVDPAEATGSLPAVYDTVRQVTPGMVTRSPRRWRAWASYDVLHGRRQDAGSRQIACWDDRGYVSYQVARERGHRDPNGTVLIGELLAADSEAYRGLWAWCLGLDQVSVVSAPLRPADEPLRLALPAPRRLAMSIGDGLWLRLLDVPVALSARRGGTDGAVCLDVIDDGRYAAGRYRLQVESGHVSCTRSSALPDVAMPVATLSAAYLGGTTMTALARAGKVTEHSPGSVALLDGMLSSAPTPWSPWSF
jgi:predicted acetyltransferase